jgi:hypothetical protein
MNTPWSAAAASDQNIVNRYVAHPVLTSGQAELVMRFSLPSKSVTFRFSYFCSAWGTTR